MENKGDYSEEVLLLLKAGLEKKCNQTVIDVKCLQSTVSFYSISEDEVPGLDWIVSLERRMTGVRFERFNRRLMEANAAVSRVQWSLRAVAECDNSVFVDVSFTLATDWNQQSAVPQCEQLTVHKHSAALAPLVAACPDPADLPRLFNGLYHYCHLLETRSDTLSLWRCQRHGDSSAFLVPLKAGGHFRWDIVFNPLHVCYHHQLAVISKQGGVVDMPESVLREVVSDGVELVVPSVLLQFSDQLQSDGLSSDRTGSPSTPRSSDTE